MIVREEEIFSVLWNIKGMQQITMHCVSHIVKDSDAISNKKLYK